MQVRRRFFRSRRLELLVGAIKNGAADLDAGLVVNLLAFTRSADAAVVAISSGCSEDVGIDVLQDVTRSARAKIAAVNEKLLGLQGRSLDPRAPEINGR